MSDLASVRRAGERIERLLEEIRSMAPPPAMERVEELMHRVVGLYGDGLGRIVETVGAADLDVAQVRRRLIEDPLVASLLLLHDLHPVPVAERVSEALEKVRPYLGSHAGGVQLLGIGDDGVVRLRLKGSCDGCPSSLMTVKLAIERAIEEAAPEVARVEVEGVTDEAAATAAGAAGAPLAGDPSLPMYTGNGA